MSAHLDLPILPLPPLAHPILPPLPFPGPPRTAPSPKSCDLILGSPDGTPHAAPLPPSPRVACGSRVQPGPKKNLPILPPPSLDLAILPPPLPPGLGRPQYEQVRGGGTQQPADRNSEEKNTEKLGATHNQRIKNHKGSFLVVKKPFILTLTPNPQPHTNF